MRTRRGSLEIFSLSFLDIIACGFGAIVLLVLISRDAYLPFAVEEQPELEQLEEALRAERSVAAMEQELAQELAFLEAQRGILAGLSDALATVAARERQEAAQAAKTKEDLAGLQIVQDALEEQSSAATTARRPVVRDDEIGGIPADSDYVIFIIDTSGSMQEIWGRVTREVENVLRSLPNDEGFQILNDNGAHLVSAYAGKWIPDTPRRRQSVLRLLRSWKSASNSSPVEGLQIALQRYVTPDIDVAIYIFGDEYSGGSYDPVINALGELNKNRVTGKYLARVHAVGFISPFSTGRFAILMREVTRRNGGSFLAMAP